MGKIFLAFIMTVVMASCTKEEIQLLEGRYTGTFQRRASDGTGNISNVSIEFSDNTWSGTGDTNQYPALCNGSYSLTTGNISFTNACVWTANFDWTLILKGDYVLSVTGDEVEFYKEYGNGVKDIYKLKKKTTP